MRSARGSPAATVSVSVSARPSGLQSVVARRAFWIARDAPGPLLFAGVAVVDVDTFPAASPRVIEVVVGLGAGAVEPVAQTHLWPFFMSGMTCSGVGSTSRARVTRQPGAARMFLSRRCTHCWWPVSARSTSRPQSAEHQQTACPAAARQILHLERSCSVLVITEDGPAA